MNNYERTSTSRLVALAVGTLALIRALSWLTGTTW